MAPSTRSLLSSLAAAVTLVAATSALAAPPPAPVNVVTNDAADSCGARSVAVARWVPSLGPAARFIVAEPTRFVALGRTEDGFWSSQWTTPGDACDDCGHLDLVYTRFADGRSTRYPVLREEDRRAFDKQPGAGTPAAWAAREAALRDLMLQRLWRYAATVWPVATLRHDYAIVTPKEDPVTGAPAPYRGWLVGIVQGGCSRLRFTTDMAHQMCWCFESWRSFAPTR